MTPAVFKGCVVTRNGTIDPCGTVRIIARGWAGSSLASRVSKNLTENDGHPLYSDKLVGKTDCTARISGEILVIEKDGTVVTTLSADELSSADMRRSYVLRDGFLQWDGWGKSNKPREVYLEVRRAMKGIRPDHFDNSSFVRILSKKYDGRKVYEIRIGIMKQTCRVFTKRGELLPSEILRPLAFDKWEKPVIKNEVEEFYKEYQELKNLGSNTSKFLKYFKDYNKPYKEEAYSL